MVRPLLVLDVVGLTPDLLAHAPNLAALAREGFSAPLTPVLPAVTCTAQSSRSWENSRVPSSGSTIQVRALSSRSAESWVSSLRMPSSG